MDALSTSIAEKGLKDGLVAYFKAIGAVSTFNSFGRASKITLCLMFLLGLVALAFFWTTDVGIDVKIGSWDIKRFGLLRTFDENWMHTHAYAPNILAGVTGFLIGAPVAAVILSGFTTQREENAALARVNELSQLAWDNFLEDFEAFNTPERMNAVMNMATDANEQHNRAYQAVYDFIARIFRGQSTFAYDAEDYPRTTTQIYEAIQACYDPFNAAVEPITTALVDPDTIETQWSALLGSWNTLDQYVRLQRLEQRLEWFIHEDRKVYAELRKFIGGQPKSANRFCGNPRLSGECTWQLELWSTQ